MSASLSDSALWAGLLGDPEIGPLFTDEAEIAAMIEVERALARAQAAVGAIPAEAARAIDDGLAGAEIAPEALAEGVARDGVPVSALVSRLRARLGGEAAHRLHWGATSQDVMDSGLALRLARALDALEARLDPLERRLAETAERHAATPMAARTRARAAAPVSYGLRVAHWLHPLPDLRDRLAALRPRLLRVQFGGAVGARSAVAPHGEAVAAALAAELGLVASPPWHVQRAALGELGGWCADLCGALAKMAGDMILMSRDEASELRLAGGGGSSTMPNKANPVAAEAVVALARHVAALAGSLHAAPAEERDGATLTLERLTLPPLTVSTGAALGHAAALVEAAEPDPHAMARGLARGGGATLAEAAAYALSARMPRMEAEALVKAALARAAAEGRPLAEILAEEGPEGIDWSGALDPEAVAAPARAVIDAILSRTRR